MALEMPLAQTKASVRVEWLPASGIDPHWFLDQPNC